MQPVHDDIAPQDGELHIEQHDIRLTRGRHLKGFHAIFALTNNDDVICSLQQVLDASSHSRMVVNDYYPDFVIMHL